MIDQWVADRCHIAALDLHGDASGGTRPDQWTGKAPGSSVAARHEREPWVPTNCGCSADAARAADEQLIWMTWPR